MYECLIEYYDCITKRKAILFLRSHFLNFNITSAVQAYDKANEYWEFGNG